MAENNDQGEWRIGEKIQPLENGAEEWTAGPTLQDTPSGESLLHAIWQRPGIGRLLLAVGMGFVGGTVGRTAMSMTGTPELAERAGMFGAVATALLTEGFSNRQRETAFPAADLVQYPLLVGLMYICYRTALPTISRYGPEITMESVLGATGGVAVGEGINIAAALLARVTRRP